MVFFVFLVTYCRRSGEPWTSLESFRPRSELARKYMCDPPVFSLFGLLDWRMLLLRGFWVPLGDVADDLDHLARHLQER